MRVIALLSFCASLLFAPTGLADAEPANATPHTAASDSTDLSIVDRNTDAAKAYTVDTSVPSAPALALLGAETPQTIGAPFGGDQYVNIGPGESGLPEIAFATRPYWTLFNQSQNIDTYRGWANPDAPDRPTFGERLRHIEGRTLVSFAVGPVRGAKPERSGAAIGLSTSLFDHADPRMDSQFSGCVRGVLEASRGPLGITDEEAKGLAQAFAGEHWNKPDEAAGIESFFSGNSWSPHTQRQLAARFTDETDRTRAGVLYSAAEQTRATRYQAASDKAYHDCVDAAGKRYLERDDLSIGIGAMAESEDDSSLSGLEYSGASVWIGYRHPLAFRDNRQGSFNAYYRFEDRQHQALENNVVSDSQTSIAYVDYSLQTDRWRFSLGASWNRREYANAAVTDREFSRISTSIEYQVQDKTWVQAGYGALSEDVPGEDSFAYLRLKFNMSSTLADSH